MERAFFPELFSDFTLFVFQQCLGLQAQIKNQECFNYPVRQSTDKEPDGSRHQFNLLKLRTKHLQTRTAAIR